MVLVRLVLIYAFLMFTSPIATHALARAAIATGVEPLIVAEGDEE
jgi:multisubunit Na+/H+ antiporter MnhG subunit